MNDALFSMFSSIKTQTQTIKNYLRVFCRRVVSVDVERESVKEHVERERRELEEIYSPELVRDWKCLDETSFLALQEIPVYVCTRNIGRRFYARTTGDLYIQVTDLIREWENNTFARNGFVQPLRNQGFTLVYNNKPLSKRNLPLYYYDVKAGARIDLQLGGLLGGSSTGDIAYDYQDEINVNLVYVGTDGRQERYLVPAKYSSDLYTRVFEIQLYADDQGLDAFETPLVGPAPILRFGLKHLSQNPVKLHLYGIRDNDYVIVHRYRGLGGFKFTFPSLCRTASKYTLGLVDMEMIEAIVTIAGGVISREEIVNLAELFYIAKCQAQKCEGVHDYIMLFMTVYRMYFGTSIVNTMLDKISEYEVSLQAEEVDDFETLLKEARKMMDRADAIDRHPLLLKTHKLFSFMLVKGMLIKFGFDMTSDEYSRLDRINLTRDYSSSKDFVKCVLDTTIYVIERIYVWKKTGSLASALNTEENYTKWFTEADKLIALAPFTSNLEAHGTNYHAFLMRVDRAIEEGDNYIAFSAAACEFSKNLFSKKLNALKLVKNSELTKRASLKERKSPFGVLVHAGSSVAKSTFSKMLFAYYASLFGLDNKDESRYVRCPASDFWDNFASSMWCIHFDDIAAFNPAKLSDVDPTVKEILNVINNVAYVPPQADLADKGKTPVLAQLVTATTNTPHLNANEYFCCELAVRRRFPFVVTLKPKDDYKHANGRFIDPEKIPETQFYPDLWDIVVQKIEPRIDCGKERAILVDVETFDDVNKFLQYFGKKAQEHDSQQNKAMRADRGMMNLQVCRNCFAPKHACGCEPALQAEEADVPIIDGIDDVALVLRHNLLLNFIHDKVSDVYEKIKGGIFYAFLKRPAFLSTTMWFLSFPLGRWIASFCIKGAALEYQIALVAKINECVGNLANANNLKKGVIVLQIVAFLYTAYYMIKGQSEPQPRSSERIKRRVETKIVEDYEIRTKDLDYEADEQWDDYSQLPSNAMLQGNESSKPMPDHPFETEEEKDVWYWTEPVLEQFDLPVASLSTKEMSAESFRDIVEKNCVIIHVMDLDRKKWIRMRGIMLKGQICLTVHHFFKTVLHKHNVVVKVQCAPDNGGVTANHEFTLSLSTVFRDEVMEIAAFQIPNMPPFKDITKFWMINRQMYVKAGFELSRTQEGDVCIAHSYAIDDTRYQGTLNYEQDCWWGRSSSETKQGDCGSMFVAKTPRGLVIGGMHLAGLDNMTVVLKVDKDQIDEILNQPQFNRMPIIQGGGAPMLSSEEYKFEIGPLHHKSVFRYLEKGSANVYGTLTGFRPRPSSKVRATPFQKEVLEHFDTEVKYGRPVMVGWEVWRKNIEPVVTMGHQYDSKVLEAVTDAYVADVVERLPKNWESQLVVLTNIQAVNGIPGVMYIDRLKSDTSMGHPWRTSKNKYLIKAPSEEYPDGVTFPEEIWVRVQEIENRYSKGLRAFPIFTEHLKDEARSFKKIQQCKTRGFSGGPVDFMIVMRKYLLSFVRLIQKNKFVFEAAVGTVVQSTEWTQIHRYLNSFGTDNKIAGDFAAFDKKMKAHEMLCAGRAIYDVHRIAGVSSYHLLMLSGIFHDLAFHVKNFNGDIVMVRGSNPSGHALTVVINCVVNSLYMRYTYCILHPRYQISLKTSELVNITRTFKQNVRLLTYGDDNIQDVRNTVPWYNHTSISKALKTIGIEYTMADKDAESIPYIPMSECSFLKRTWVFDHKFEAYMAPLEEESIIKSLTVWVPSRSIPAEMQFVAVCASACFEFWYYGEERFNKERQFLMELTSSEPYCFYVKESTFPTYHELAQRFVDASKKMNKKRLVENFDLQGEEISMEEQQVIVAHQISCLIWIAVLYWCAFTYIFSSPPVFRGGGFVEGLKFKEAKKHYRNLRPRFIKALALSVVFRIVHEAFWRFNTPYLILILVIHVKIALSRFL